MFTLTLWLIIAFIGLILYISPAFFTRRMYEGFQSESSLTTATPSAPKNAVNLEENLKAIGVAPATQIQSSPNSTAGPSPDIDTLMRNIEDVMRVQTYTPDLGTQTFIPAVGCPTAPINAVGAKELPKEAETTKSQPATSHDDASSSSSLDQGKSFQDTIPKSNPAEEPFVVERVIERVVEVPSKCPEPRKCPPSPVCPDMRDYIRKDSIPCWGCKLK